MIDDKKLLCAFIYSAYESGNCGFSLEEGIRENRKKLCRDYIKTGEYFPEKEIKDTQAIMEIESSKKSIREYIYMGHQKVVLKKIQSLNPATLRLALLCPVNFYKVTEVNNGSITVNNLFIPERFTKTRLTSLILLPGLETPRVGDTVSGHWNCMLEVVTAWTGLDNYTEASEKYLENILK